MIEVFLLSIIQGVTEFIPVSSSAHLILFSKLFNFNSENLIIDVSLHFGSFAAIVFYFRKEILDFLKNKNLFFLIILSSLPTLLFGFLLIKLNLIVNLRSIKIIGWTTLFFGIILYFSDLRATKNKINSDFNLKCAIIIGLIQILALIPGVSRSGITISVARFLQFERSEAAKISFWLSIPTLGAIGFYNIQKLIKINEFTITIENYFAMLISFIFSLIAIKYFIKYLQKFSMLIFVIYRLILGIILIFFYS
jgi:undecaprenyl-diphosphatase